MDAEGLLTFVHRKLRAYRSGTVAAGSQLITSSSAGIAERTRRLNRSFTPKYRRSRALQHLGILRHGVVSNTPPGRR